MKHLNRATLVISTLIATALTGCVTVKDAPQLAALDVQFTWSPADRCKSASPEFIIGNIPPETKTLEFRMVDLDVPSFNHGGGTVAYSGENVIPAGAFSYTGPCPPSGSHKYQFTVTALNAAGDVALGRGKATRSFP